jgi:hypothetical protein
MYIPRNWELGFACQTLAIFGGVGGWTPQPPSVRHWLVSLNVKWTTNIDKKKGEDTGIVNAYVNC